MDNKSINWFSLVAILIVVVGGAYWLGGHKGNVPSSPSSAQAVELFYNKTTGELYPILPDEASVHTCVWTILGDHGSETTLTTEGISISNDTNPYLKSNKFLPPRVPIYVTCVNWQNKNYYGAVGEYK